MEPEEVRRASSGQRGMSMVEIMVSVGIISLLLVTVFNILPGAVLAVEHAEEEYLAMQVAQSVIEQQRGTPVAQMTQVSNEELAAVTVNNIAFTPFLTIQAQDDQTPPLMMVTVTVQWHGEGGAQVAAEQLEIANMTLPSP